MTAVSSNRIGSRGAGVVVDGQWLSGGGETVARVSVLNPHGSSRDVRVLRGACRLGDLDVLSL